MDDLRSNIERPIAFDGIMRVRTSTGILSIHTNLSDICNFLFRVYSKIKEIKKFKLDKKINNKNADKKINNKNAF